jgi:16S rRNA processing protein RimM
VSEPTVVVGKVTKAHGLRGEVVVLVTSDNPARFASGASVFLEQGRELRVRSSRSSGSRLLVAFHGIDDRAAAEALRGVTLVVPRSMLPALADGEYWPHELKGCAVVTESGRALGIVADVVSSRANDLWVAVDEQGTETLVPAIREVVVEVDIGVRRVVVRDIPGLTVPDDEASI